METLHDKTKAEPVGLHTHIYAPDIDVSIGM